MDQRRTHTQNMAACTVVVFIALAADNIALSSDTVLSIFSLFYLFFYIFDAPLHRHSNFIVLHKVPES